MARLTIPPEPLDIKERIIKIRQSLTKNWAYGIRWDNLAIWAFNLLPKYLWRYWKNELRREGISWQEFLVVLRYETKYIRAWAFENLPWRKLVNEIIDSLEFELRRKRSSKKTFQL